MPAVPEPSDPEVAAATFAEHLDRFFADRRHQVDGWGLIRVSPRVAVAVVPAQALAGGVDPYFVRMDADWYDRYPPKVAFAEPVVGWPDAPYGSQHYPAIAGSPTPEGPGYAGQAIVQFALHANYSFEGGEQRQLVCFSHSFDYYTSGHNPTDEQRWVQGTHTVSATLSRLHSVLQAPSYLGPSIAVHP
jgi:hypothetical protein